MMTPGREARSLEPPRLEGETAMAYGRFIEFCRLGTQRTCAELSRRFGKSPAAFEKMGVRYRWHERVQEYDQAVDAINAEAWDFR